MPTGIFRMQAASYNKQATELAWIQPNVTNTEVVVAVLDTGIDAGHPDLVNNVVGGLSFVGEDPLEDLNGHGTHVAGTISANNNGFGTSGVYPGTKVFALQVFNKLGTGSTSSIVGAINWLATTGRQHKIRVANMSLGGPSSVAVCNAVTYAIRAGITFVVAAGASWLPARELHELVAKGSAIQHPTHGQQQLPSLAAMQLATAMLVLLPTTSSIAG